MSKSDNMGRAANGSFLFVFSAGRIDTLGIHIGSSPEVAVTLECPPTGAAE